MTNRPSIFDQETRANLIWEFSQVLNRHSLESDSNTPDHILAEYLVDCLANLNLAVTSRENWYGRDGKDLTQLGHQELVERVTKRMGGPTVEEVIEVRRRLEALTEKLRPLMSHLITGEGHHG